MRHGRFLIFLVLMMGEAQGQQNATTSDGRTVILKADGTWEFVRETAATTEYISRNTSWGMTRKQVKASELNEIVREEDSYISYKGEVSGLDCFIIYYFVGEILTRSRYVIVEQQSNKNDYLRDYVRIQMAIKDKYGEPDSDGSNWKNTLYENNPAYLGLAVSLGHLTFGSDWSRGSTLIRVRLSGDNHKISLTVDYASVELRALEEAKEQEKSRSEF
jgi:hypothetical protein